MSYVYAETDPRRVPGRYFYTPFEGPAFLDAYHTSRGRAIEALRAHAAAPGGTSAPAVGLNDPQPPVPVPVPGQGPVETVALLRAILAGEAVPSPTRDAWRDILVRKLEVTRVLRAHYGPDGRAGGPDEAPLEAYALLATLLLGPMAQRAATPDSGHLSAALKAGDILAHAACAAQDPVPAAVARAAADALEAELALVARMQAAGIPAPSGTAAPFAWAAPASARGGSPSRVVLLAADTARARAYLDGALAAGLAPAEAIVVTLASAPPAGTSTAARPVTGLFDNTTPLPHALDRAGIPARHLDVDRLDAPAVLDVLAGLAPALVVIAPPAGVLLAPAFFAIPGLRYLHVHPGQVPGYRGSTPMYHQLLAEGRLVASALLLDAGIDTGGVLGERIFDAPGDRTSIDHVFDPWMRAATLVDVLAAYAAGRELVALPQAGPARTWFVIHPVLRHVALLAERTGTHLPATAS